MNLTDRQKEILILLAEGNTSREIGEKLHISARTVEMTTTLLKRKIGTKNTTNLIAEAIRQKIIV